MKIRRLTAPIRRILILSFAILFAAPTVRAQTPVDSTRELAAMRTDLDQIKADQGIIKAQLAQILRMLS